MKFLADVNASGILAHWLGQMGYIVDLASGAIVVAQKRKFRIRRR